jgi:hypothetical protein
LGKEGVVSTADFNDDLISDIREKTETYASKAEESLSELLSLANDKLWNTMGYSSANLERSREISLGSLADLPSNRPAVNIPAFTFNPEDYLTTDLLQKYTYESDFFDYLDPVLREFIGGESAFIDQTVQEALFQQTRERDIQTLNDALDAVDRRMAQRGFPLRTSMSEAARTEVIKKYQDVSADRNKEITALIAERAHDGHKHGIDAGVRMEDIRSRFQLEYGRLYFQVAEYLVRKYQADVQAEVSRVTSEIDQLRLKASIDTTMVQADSTWANALLDSLRTSTTRLIADSSADLDIQKTQAQMQIDALTKMINFYADAHSAYAGQINGISLDTSE